MKQDKITYNILIAKLSIALFCFTLIANAQKREEAKIKLKDQAVSVKSKNEKLIAFNGADGPYIINESLICQITELNQLHISSLSDRDSIKVTVDNKERDSFYVKLESKYTTPNTYYKMPDKLVVISDIEGNYNALYSLLFSNKIIDKHHNWIFGDGHLVLNGDIVDRGKNVTQILWLLYKLDQQAERHNGKVHIILGNHEIMNFYGDHRYNHAKYIKAAQDISGLTDKKEAIKYVYSQNSELGKWLSSKNIIEKIGNYIFTHGGLSKELLDYNLSIKEINDLVRANYYSFGKDTEDKTIRFLYSSKSPFWYRGLAKKKLKSKNLDDILNYYDAEKIVVGHTPVKEIISLYDGKLINTDVKHSDTKFSGKSAGLLIENCEEFAIDDTGGRKRLYK